MYNEVYEPTNRLVSQPTHDKLIERLRLLHLRRYKTDVDYHEAVNILTRIVLSQYEKDRT